ncbi:hypothetical protein [Herbaspirillum sp. alder98]|uniref:hypothetical protein n=1 Tax=Herbaspirillum sp. alder98 TaxID=2913096 RepID=UPI001CD88832|nr:hypothetical protein [Herbaspirillum sp. alder98]MCA1323757.1 hypothetical protein [Herbaspirillum sp. alder98]
MIRNIVLALILALFAQAASALQAPVSKMQNAVSGAAQQKMQSRGFTPSDPRYSSTLMNMGGSIAGLAAGAAVTAIAGATAPAWVTLFAAGVVGIAVAAAVQDGLNWYFKDSGQVQVGDNPQSINTPAGLAAPSEMWCYGTLCSPSKDATCSFRPEGSGTSQGRTYITTHAPVGTECHAIWTFTDTGFQVDIGASGAPSLYGRNTRICPGIGLSATNGTCPASNFPEPAGAPVKTLADAVSALTEAQKAMPLSPQIVADLANEAWKDAAAAPGYDGLPYDATNPITATEVATWQSANPTSWPSVGDFVAPQPAPSGGTAGTPFTMPTSTTPVQVMDPTAPSTGTNPSTEPLSNLGPDPGIGAPGLEPIPTAQQIIAPLTNAFPSVKSFVVPNIDAQCPTWQVPVFGKDIGFTNHCALLEQTRPTLVAVMAAIYALMALFIVLRA